MSSWLNLSSNIGNLSGNFSSITGQISNFTREVLTESTEENFDQDAELKLAHIKVKDLESVIQKQKNEVERINGLNEELHDRAVSAELQIQALSDEYRSVIEQKENEIKALKSSHVDMKHGQGLSHKDESFSRDGMEFEDPEFFQMTVSKLKKELEEVKDECQHWKQAAKDQNNQPELQRIKEDHQQEVASLQSMYSQRISQINKKHRSELEDLITENEKLANDVKDHENRSGFGSGKTPIAAPEVSKDLEDKYRKLSIDYEIKKKQLESIQTQILEEKKLRKSSEEQSILLREEIQSRNEKIIELEGEVEILIAKDDHNRNEKCVTFEDKEKLEELDRTWRTNFDKILQELNEARDENVALSLEFSQMEEKYNHIKDEHENFVKKVEEFELENEQLKVENKNLHENVLQLERLKGDIARLGNCTSDLLEELEFQKGLSEEQVIEIDSLRKICTIKGNPADEIKKMQKSLKELGRRYVELFQHYQKVSLELRKSNDRLRAERQLRHNSASQVREEISNLQERLQQATNTKLTAYRADAKQLQSEMTTLDQQLDRREHIVAELQIDSELASEDVSRAVSGIGSHANRLNISKESSEQNETIDSLIAEKAILERTIEGLERKVGSLEALVTGAHEDCSTVDGTASPPRTASLPRTAENSPRDSDIEPERKMRRIDKEESNVPSGDVVQKAAKILRPFSIPESIVSSDGYYFDEEEPEEKQWVSTDQQMLSREQRKIHELEEKLLRKEKELNEIIAVKNDLDFEKGTLEKVVLDLQRKLKARMQGVGDGAGFVDVSHQGSETELSALDLDCLVEAREERKALAEKLEHAREDSKHLAQELKQAKDEHKKFVEELKELRSELDHTYTVADSIGWFLAQQRPNVDILNTPEDDFSSDDGVDGLDKMVRNLFSVLLKEAELSSKEIDDLKEEVDGYKRGLRESRLRIDALKNGNDRSTNELSAVMDIAQRTLRFVTETRNRRLGRHEDASPQDESCEAVLKCLHSVIENFVLEFAGETDADKWRKKHDELSSEKDILAQEISSLRDNLRVLNTRYRSAVDENTSLLETVDMLRQDLELMSQGQSALAAEREQLQAELDKLQFQIDTNETDDSKEIGELKMQLDDLKMEKERIMKMVNDRDDFIVEQQEKHDNLVYQLMEEKDRDLQELQGQLEQTMNLFKEKQEENASLLSRVEMLEEECGSLNTRVLELEKEVGMRGRKIENIETELNDKMRKEVENEVLMKSIVDEDEELREREIMEEDASREQEILIQELRSENAVLRDELNKRDLLAQNDSSLPETEETDGRGREDLISEIATLNAELVQYHEMGDDIENWKNQAEESIVLLQNNEELMKEIADCKNTIENLERRISEVEGSRAAVQKLQDNVEVIAQEESRETKIDIEQTQQAAMQETNSELEFEQKRLRGEYAKSQARLSELELEVETYKRFERIVDEKENEIERFKSELARMMQVLRSKDELLLNLQMMDEESNPDSPFSSRSRVIQHIRDKETEIEHMNEKVRTLEDLAKHHSSQLELLKVERENSMIFMRQKEEEAIDLNERLENIQARSVAKEHASAVLHAEHQKLMELNKSQGSEIARMRERNQYLQNILQERQNQSVNERMINDRNQELEIQLAAFQQEQERLLTLIHEKDKYNVDLRKKLELAEAASENLEIKGQKSVDQSAKALRANLDQKMISEEVRTKSESTSSVAPEVMEVGSSGSSDESSRHNVVVKSLEEKLKILNDNNSKLMRDNEELKQKLDLYDNEKRTIRTQMENEIHEKSMKIRDLEVNINEIEKRTVELTRSFDQERSKITQNFETRTRLLSQEWEEKMRLKNNEIKSLLEKNELLESIQEQIKKSEKTNNRTVTEIETLTLENKKLHSLYEEKKNELSVLQGDIHRLKNISSASEAALSKIQADNRYMIEEGIRKDNGIEDLTKQKTLAEQKIQQLETEVRRLHVSCREVEARATKEMERLRNHLIQIEEGYTNEAVVAQERESSLEKRLHELQEMLQMKNSKFKETSDQSSFQIQNLQQQLFAVASQRDDAVSKLSRVQDKARQTETALNNLQMVLEQLQREKDSQYELLAEQSKRKLMEANREVEDLRKKENAFQARIQEASLAVQGVANLSNEVKSKSDLIDTLKKEVSVLRDDLNAKMEAIRKLKDSTEGKVEKPLMKNLLLGYFHTPENKRPEVVRVLGNLIGFSQDEISQVGSGAPPVARTWVSQLNPFGGPPKSNLTVVKRQDSSVASSLSKSFSEMFVSFLEEESTGNKANRQTTNQLTSLLMEPPKSFSTPMTDKSSTSQSRDSIAGTSIIANPLLVTPQEARAIHSNAFKTNLPRLPSSGSTSTPLFPAPGQEIPRVHTSTANSALRTMLAK